MHLFPDELQSAIDHLTDKVPLASLTKAREELSSLYRSTSKKLHSDTQRLAYALTRLPATYSVVMQVLEECGKRVSLTEISSLLDIGSGPGTVLWAAHQMLPSLQHATMLDCDEGFLKLGKQLCQPLAIDQQWIKQDVKKEVNTEPHDLVVASYSIGEFGQWEEAVKRLWGMTNKILIIVEPGTPEGFANIHKYRECLIAQNAHVVAPCPHALQCPIRQGDWCHFSTRLNRTSFHRKMKHASLSYEDEKFSYLIFSKEPLITASHRIVRHPFKGTGFVKFHVCSSSGIEQKTLSKKNKEQYSLAKKLKWGDELLIVD